ncbi:FecR family protein [Membranihabitans marinus]|uniref:FecR family protein n=1 Tax=Membranihabitans marinus TaxID=1227546 RepID=UPI001F3AFAA1|nr:FecR domain-containing protein [Membranihabitans marinus]
MEKGNNIQKVLRKFVDNTCSEEELQQIIDHINSGKASPDEVPTVEEVLSILESRQKLSDKAAAGIYTNIVGSKIAREREPNPKLRYLKMHWKSVAAVAAIIIMTGYGIWTTTVNPAENNKDIVELVESQLNLGEEMITLELDNGKVEIIRPDGSVVLQDEEGNILGRQDQSGLNYTENNVEVLTFNTLKVPYGKRFKVELSDGTTVNLNAGTSLRYPVKFLEDEESRSVYLMGEAYFDVAKKEDQPFIVHSEGVEVAVLGTAFNMSNYPEDENTDVVLVEGLVQLQTDKKETNDDSAHLLQPGYKASFDKQEKTFSQQEVSTSIYTSWVNGGLIFRNMAFEDILIKLERKYNVEINNTNAALADVKFNASFEDEPIANVLEYFKTVYEIDFNIENNVIIIQ